MVSSRSKPPTGTPISVAKISTTDSSSSLGLLALGAETTEGSVVSLDVDATGLLLEFGHAELDESVVEIFATEMGVPVGGLDLEDTILNGEEGHIESATTEIEDEDVAF